MAPRYSTASRTRKILVLIMVLVSLFLLGTVIVLSTVSYFLAIPSYALLSKDDVGPVRLPPRWREKEALEKEWGKVGGRGHWDGKVDGTESWHALENITVLEGERIPRIIHQTWKDEYLPEKWRDVYLTCRSVLPSYTYHLWTDASSRSFLAAHYAWFLPTYDNYPYPIQRADAIRYFVLHRYGGVYMDLDVGCRRELGGLVGGEWDVVLAKTIPVGVSNDVMLASPGHPFMEMTIHSLVTFAHRYVTNYPTVMFSTGPMFLSAQYGIYTSAHPLSSTYPRPEIRILPKSLYGKNAKPEESTEAFFSHYYGSSWHADDAGFITWLGRYGRIALWAGIAFVLFAAIRFVWSNRRNGKLASGARNSVRKLVVAVGGSSASSENAGGATRFELLSFLPGGSSMHGSMASSPTTSSSPSLPSSPILNEAGGPQPSTPLTPAETLLAFRRAASEYLVGTPAGVTYTGTGSRRRKIRKGVLYFLPAIFAPHSSSTSSSSRRSTLVPPIHPNSAMDLELGLAADGGPPPYDDPSTPNTVGKIRVLDHIDELLKKQQHQRQPNAIGDVGASAGGESADSDEAVGWSDWEVKEEQDDEDDEGRSGSSSSIEEYNSDEPSGSGRC